MLKLKNRIFNVTGAALLGATSLVTLHLAFDAVGIVSKAYGAEDCHMRPADNPCTQQEQIDFNTSTINLVGEAAVNNLISIIDIKDHLSDYDAANGTNGQAIIDNGALIDTNADNIVTNADNIATNKGDIVTNADNIGTNQTAISTNQIAVGTNQIAIGTNQIAIGSNANNISANESNIIANAQAIVGHGTRIGTNESNIGANQEAIVDHGTRIDTNESNIGTNTAAITAHEALIVENSGAIGRNINAIQANTGRIDEAFMQLDTLTEDVDKLKSGVAMAVAIGNAPIVRAEGKRFSLSGGVGYFDTEIAAAIKFAMVPTDYSVVNVSVGYDFGDNYTIGAGAGFAF